MRLRILIGVFACGAALAVDEWEVNPNVVLRKYTLFVLTRGIFLINHSFESN